MKKIIVSLSLLLVMFLTIPVCLAVGGGPTTMNDIVEYVENAAKWFTTIVLILGVFMLTYAALVWMTAGGDEDKLKSAKKWLIYAIVGIIVALLAWFIVGVVASFLGVTL